MFKLDFKQPIFGSNYLETYCKPLYGMIPADAHIKIWFTEGGCDKFLKIFDIARKQVVNQLKAGKTHHEQGYNSQIQQGVFGANAYHDPNDPTVVYTQQPSQTLGNTNNFLGSNFYQPQSSPNLIENYNSVHNHNYPLPNQNYPPSNQNYPPLNQNYPDQNQNYVSSDNNYFPQGQMQNIQTQPQMPMPYGQPQGQMNNYISEQPYTVGMNNAPQAYNQQPGVAYYFGIPMGPRVERNNYSI